MITPVLLYLLKRGEVLNAWCNITVSSRPVEVWCTQFITYKLNLYDKGLLAQSLCFCIEVLHVLMYAISRHTYLYGFTLYCIVRYDMVTVSQWIMLFNSSQSLKLKSFQRQFNVPCSVSILFTLTEPCKSVHQSMQYVGSQESYVLIFTYRG